MMEGPQKPKTYIKQEEVDAGGENHTDYFKDTLTPSQRDSLKAEIQKVMAQNEIQFNADVVELNKFDLAKKYDDHNVIVQNTIQYASQDLTLPSNHPGSEDADAFLKKLDEKYHTLDTVSKETKAELDALNQKKQLVLELEVLVKNNILLKDLLTTATFPYSTGTKEINYSDVYERTAQYDTQIKELRHEIDQIDRYHPNDAQTPEAIEQYIQNLLEQQKQVLEEIKKLNKDEEKANFQ